MSESLAAEFISYYNNLTQVNGTCRIFERNDKYCCYGIDAKLIAKVLASVKLKLLEADGESLHYVSMTKGHFIEVLRHLLFIIQYKVKIMRNFGTGKNSNWKPVGEASPGNLTSVEDLLFDHNSYAMPQRGLLAVKITNESNEMVVGVTFCDPILREFQMSQFVDNPQLSTLQSVIAQLSPQECLLPVIKNKRNEYPSRSVVEEMLKLHNISKTETEFTESSVTTDLNRLLQLGEDQTFHNVHTEAYGMKVAHHSVGAILKYLELMSDTSNHGQFVLSVFKSELFAKVDLSCELGLGLFPEMKSDFHLKTYLFGFLNSCFTGAGERLLIQWIKQPLMDIRKIEERLDVVEMFMGDLNKRQVITKIISKFTDIEMLCRKIQRRKSGLQDLYKIYQMLKMVPMLVEALTKDFPHRCVEEIFVSDFQGIMDDCEKFVDMISQTLDFDAIENKEFVVKAEFDEKLLDLRKQMFKCKSKIDDELDKVKHDLGISTVKLEMFEKIGFAFRLTLKEERFVRNRKDYITIDTRSSGVRFQTVTLKEKNEKYCNLRKDYEEMQKEIVDNMVEVSASYIQPLRILNTKIAWLDVALSLTRVACKSSTGYVRPKLKEKGECHIVLKDCRHPYLEDTVRSYIPNDVEITKDKHRFYFVTGPNMGGKSTYIRSVALSVLLAQIGCYVPCSAAEISVVDAFFTRIGASDNPSKAMSTFMYEMLEMKNMISNSTSDSLLIIDEMGRGTSTYDGFGLSWAISRRVAEKIKAPCLFATHFHDLTTLSDIIPSIGNLHVDAICSKEKVTFLYHVKPGVCSESFGIHVAKLAAFPLEVIELAEKKLEELEKSCISLDQISSEFAGLPDGDKFIQIVQEAFPSSGCRPKKRKIEPNGEPMDVDEVNDGKSSNISEDYLLSPEMPILLRDYDTSKRLLTILEEMEKKLDCSQ